MLKSNQRIASFLLAAWIAAGCATVRAQAVSEVIRTPEKSISVVNQSLAGTWLYELRRGGQPATQAPVLLLIQFHSDGTIVASAADGTQSSHHGDWLRVGDR